MRTSEYLFFLPSDSTDLLSSFLIILILELSFPHSPLYHTLIQLFTGGKDRGKDTLLPCWSLSHPVKSRRNLSEITNEELDHSVWVVQDNPQDKDRWVCTIIYKPQYCCCFLEESPYILLISSSCRLILHFRC